MCGTFDTVGLIGVRPDLSLTPGPGDFVGRIGVRPDLFGVLFCFCGVTGRILLSAALDELWTSPADGCRFDDALGQEGLLLPF